MSLLFPRLAHNHAKNGYFPTDDGTLERLVSYFYPVDRTTSLFDPCAGEGRALAILKHALLENSEADLTAYGIEYDKGRAYQAKSRLDTCIHADIQDCLVKNNQFGLLFLNPPYGDLLSDAAHSGQSLHGGRQRLEKLFFEQTVSSLVFGGIMMLIIPDYCLDKAFIQMISRRFTNVRAFRARDDTFKQIVILGERVRIQANRSAKATAEMLMAYAETGFPEMKFFAEPFYTVPTSSAQLPVIYTKVDQEQLGDELRCEQGLWSTFQASFLQNKAVARRPLYRMSDWHLALSLAAGLVSGVVVSNDGTRRVLVKGTTVKSQTSTQEISVDDDGNTTETVTRTDKFVPTIRAIELTDGPVKGQIFTIQ